KPVVDTTVGLTQQIGATTGLGAPVDGVLTQVGGTVSGLGDTVAGTGL
ncbi:collagen-like triple helix repeat-containing protein, partial [Bordetella pertussis]